jgi:lysozyme
MNRDKLAAQLTVDEGCIDHVYADSLGYLTIGVGRLIDGRKGGKLSGDEIAYLLKNDIAEVEAELDKRLPWWRRMSESRQRVLANMRFNLGMDGLLGFRNTLKAMEEGRYDDAAEGMMNSKWAGQVGDRAKRLAGIMRKGVD